MMQEPKTGRRVVSKGAYAGGLSKKVGIGTVGMSCLVLTFLFFLVFLGCVGALLIGLITKEKDMLLTGLIGAPIFFLLSAICAVAALFSLQRTLKIDTGVPLTRSNTADLPAPISLVRASSEPTREQQAILLRAAAQGAETPQEELVRGSVGE